MARGWRPDGRRRRRRCSTATAEEREMSTRATAPRKQRKTNTGGPSPTRRPPCSTASPPKRDPAARKRSTTKAARGARVPRAPRAPQPPRERQFACERDKCVALICEAARDKLIRLCARGPTTAGTADQGRPGGPAGEVRPDAARELRAHAGAARAATLDDARRDHWRLRRGPAWAGEDDELHGGLGAQDDRRGGRPRGLPRTSSVASRPAWCDSAAPRRRRGRSRVLPLY